MPCSQFRAQELLQKRKAIVHKLHPFTIRLKFRVDGATQPVALKLDPGSKKTGIALVHKKITATCILSSPLYLAELEHRGASISKALQQRKAYRKGRRSRNLRYRTPRFHNRPKPEGWLAPSLRHRVDGTMSIVERYRLLCPITKISSELVRFDMQLMDNAEIRGTEYQQGTLAGFEVREYLLAKWGRCCAYCGNTEVPLQVEHIQAKAKGGTNRISNLCLACEKCNQQKGATSIALFLKKKPRLLQKILAQAKAPLKDAAAVNATRWALVTALKTTGLPVETASGGKTKYNRTRLKVPKTHALDALCIGEIDQVARWNLPTVEIKGMGRGRYQRTLVDASGFPRSRLPKEKQVHGFQTGDQVRARVTKGKKIGTYTGRAAVRASGYFNIKTKGVTIQGVSHKDCTLLARGDGYHYQVRAPLFPFSSQDLALRAALLSAVNDGVSALET